MVTIDTKSAVPHPRLSGEDLHSAHPYGLVLEDFTPFVDALECRIGRRYWLRRGTAAFTTGEVPNVITNDGVRAARAADVLLVNCEEAHDAGTLESSIKVVELGVGLGLHARIFLKRFSMRCQEMGRDYYDRLTYYATDLSAQTLADIDEAQTLAPFGDRVRLGTLDGMKIRHFKAHQTGKKVDLKGKVRAIFHNYVFDVLPGTIVLRQEGGWFEQRLQTRLSELWRLAELGNTMSLDEIKAAAAGDDDALERLLPLYSLFRVERSFFPVDIDAMPYGHVARAFAKDVMQPFVDRTIGAERNVRLVLNWGALTSLEASLKALVRDGFLLFTDYGNVTLEGITASKQHQRYGASVSVGVSFPLLQYFVTKHLGKGARLIKPTGDDNLPLHARMMTRKPLERTQAAFDDVYGEAEFADLNRLLGEARDAKGRGDMGMALGAYAAAHDRYPFNWAILSEWANAANFHAKQPARAVELAERGLAINPTCNPDLWCEYGDALYGVERFEEAHEAFSRAMAISPTHTRSHYNMAWTHLAAGRLNEALVSCGSALATDRTGFYRERILTKQREILAQQQRDFEAERLRMRHRLE